MPTPAHYGDYQLTIYQDGLKGEAPRLPMGMAGSTRFEDIDCSLLAD